MFRQIFLLFFLILFAGEVYGQENQFLKIRVIDSLSQKPLINASISLIKKQKLIEKLKTNEFGYIALPYIEQSVLTVQYMGYLNSVIKIKSRNLADSLIIKLVPSQNQLKAVEIIGQTKFLKQDIDRLIYNVKADSDKKTFSFSEIMAKIPMISIDGNQKISLNGSKNYKILYNGRSANRANSSSEFIRLIDPNTVDRIEIITSISSKYMAEGIDGIINIVLLKKLESGFKGNIASNYTYYSNLNSNGNFDYRIGKLGLSAFLRSNVGTDNTRYRDNYRKYTNNDQLYQKAEDGFNYTTSLASLATTYEIDSLNLLTASYLFGYNNYNSDYLQTSFLNSNSISPFLINKTLNKEIVNNNELTFDYQNEGKKNKSKVLTFSYFFTKNATNRIDNVNSYNIIPSTSQSNDIKQIERTFQLDYVYPINKNLEMEIGLKSINRDYNSDFQNFYTGTYTIDKLNYYQNINAAYGSLRFKLREFGFIIGSRVEQTKIGNKVSNLFENDYFNILPSINVQKNFKGYNLNFGFSQSMERPSILHLNPYIDRGNPLFLSYGNPDLRPVLTNKLELTYNRLGKVNFRLTYLLEYANNTIEQVTNIFDSNIIASTYANVGKQNFNTINTSISTTKIKNVNLSLTGRITHQDISGKIDNQDVYNKGFRVSVMSTGSLRLKAYRLSYYMNFSSPYKYFQSTSAWFYDNSITVSRRIFKNKVSMSTTIYNPFQKYQYFRNTTISPSFQQISYAKNIYRQIGISLSYRFNKIKKEIKTINTKIENNDLKTSKQ